MIKIVASILLGFNLLAIIIFSFMVLDGLEAGSVSIVFLGAMGIFLAGMLVIYHFFVLIDRKG